MKTLFALLPIVISLFAPKAACAGLLKDQDFISNGNKRTYDLYLPSKISSKPSPMVLLLHGHFGDADIMTGQKRRKAPYKIWLSIAEREGWIVIIPDGEFGSDNHRGWNDCRKNAKTNPESDDVVFLNLLVNNIAKKYPVDKNRIYAHGTSNGGNMAYRLAQESGNKYRAIAAISASMPEQNECIHSKHPVSVLIMNGTDDPILPYDGGNVGRRKSQQDVRGSVLSVAATVNYWLTINDITSKPVTKDYPDINRNDKSTVHTKQYLNTENNTEVILFEIRGGGHTEPSLSEHHGKLYTFIVGRQNKDIEMVEEVWKFFERNQ